MKIPHVCLPWLASFLLGVGFSPAGAAPLDLDRDGVPDVWALFFEAGGLAPAGDTDGDGQSNAFEAAAGTNPRQPTSVIKVTAITPDAAGLRLTFPTMAGKGYQVQSSTSLDSPDWENVGTVTEGDGNPASAVVTAPVNKRFHRVAVVDLDSDRDGVTDYEERLLGFDPNNSHSRGTSGDDDLALITQGLRATNVISVTATDDAATEPAPNSPVVERGTFVITRSGNFNPVTVSYTVSGSATAGADYTALESTVTLPFGANSATVTVTPLTDAAVESPEAVILTVTDGLGYAVAAPSVAAVLIADHVLPTGDGVFARYWNKTSANINDTAFPTTAPALSRVELQINNTWSTNVSPGQSVNHDYFISRYTADVLPEFSQIYTFEADVNTGGRLWVNGQLIFNSWGASATSGTHSGTIELQGGRRYPIVFEHMERSGDAIAILRWASANRPEELIPQNRLFANPPPQILSPLEVLLLKGSGAFGYQIVASGEPGSYSAVNLPPGWNFDAATGLISGSPTQEGTWQIPITASNSAGSGSAVLQIDVIATGGGITRDVWSGVPGDTVAQIPLEVEPTSSTTIAALEGPQDSGDDYAARIRGYVTAPASGVYKFWITADHAAELWISDDAEPVNSFKRAEVSAATTYRGWTEAGAGKSPLLWLDAGQRYFLEVRHKESAGSDHVSVGWLKPGQGGSDPANATAPSEVVPAYALSPYIAAVAGSGGNTLFTTSLTAQGGATTSGYGSGSIHLSADESRATLRFTFANLSTPVTGAHLHDNTLPLTSNIVFDIDDAEPQADGSFQWHFEPVAGLSSAQLVQHLKDGEIYLNIHTANFTGGEIKGFFRLQAASQSFTAPPPAPTWSANHADANAASRFLIQTTFGPSAADIAAVQSLGFAAWIDAEIAKPITHHYPYVFANRSQTDDGGPIYPGTLAFNSWWRNSVTAPDQLRQRVAFALSEILVISEAGPLDDRADTISDYYDMLLDYCFGNAAITPGPSVPPADGNFLNLLKAATLHPAMGRYLDMLRNDKPNLSTGRIPNENYAREILQLFSIGLNRLWPDGSLMLSSKGEPIPTYDQNVIIGFAHAFTGWEYSYTGAYRTSFNAGANWINPMREVPVRHFTGQKRVLNNVVLPGLATVGGQPLNPHATHTAAQYNDPAYQALAAQELDATHRAIFNHPNVGPFLCRQLIQRLVTSTPSRGYLYRVVQAFNDNGAGVRGDLRAVIKAILLDYEARSPQLLSQQGFGKLREPVLRVTAVARAFPAPPPVSGTFGQGQNGDPLNLIRVATTAPHLYANGNSAFLDFSGGTASEPDDAPYAVSNVTANGFTVRPLTTETGTYSQTAGLISILNTDHTYVAGNAVYIDFTSGTPSSPADGLYTVVTRISGENFTIRPLTSIAATYSQSVDVITFTTAAPHSLTVGSTVAVEFTSGTPSAPGTTTFNVATVSPDGLQFTVTAADAVTRTGNAFATPSADAATRTGNATTTKAAYAVARTGNVAVNYGDWSMDSTNTDLNQTPIQSPTVFNFFLPDYQFPGPLSQAGLVTPEFEIVSDTSVIRQANFLYNGLFTDVLGQSGLESFKSGGRDIFVDLRPWMSTTAGPGGLPWVHNNNLAAFIDELSTRLTGGQLSTAAKTIIRTYAQSLAYSTTPSTTQLRDRVRAVVHLIVTSPDFTTQK